MQIVRKIVSLMMALSSLVFLCSCPPSPDPDPHYINAPDELELTGTSGSFQVSSNCSWTITASDPWVRTSPSSGKDNVTVTVDASENPTANGRQCKLTITDNDYETMKEVVVKQSGKSIPVTHNLKVSPESLSFGVKGDMSSFEVTSDVTWEVTCDVDWLTIGQKQGFNNGTVGVIAKANEGENKREADIVVSGGGISCVVHVEQEGVQLTLSSQELQIAVEGGQAELSITSNVSWNVSNNSTWVTVAPMSGTEGNTTIRVTANANTSSKDREANFSVKSGSVEKTVTVKQTRETLEITPSELPKFSKNGGSQVLTVTSNTKWDVTSNASTWCTVKVADNRVTVSVAKNNTYEERTCTVTVKTSTLSKSVVVVQEAADLPEPVVTPSEFSFGPESASKTLTITWPKEWTANSNQSWCRLSKNDGTGNTNLSVTVDDNKTNTDRSATITVRFGSNAAPVYISVIQSGAKIEPFLNVSPNDLSFGVDGGNKSLNVSSNVAWTVSCNQAWCSVTGSGSDNGTINVTVGSNPSDSKRPAVITVTGGGISRTINVSQDGVQLSVSRTSLQFSSAGGSEQFTVNSNTSWTVYSKPSWCNTTTSGSIVTVTTSANTSTSTLSGVVVIKAGDVKREVSVSQDPNIPDRLEVSPSSLTFDPSSGNSTVTISSNTSWKVSSNSSWCSVSRSTGSDNGSFSVSVSENTSSSSRTATITVSTSNGNITRTINVTQDGVALDVYPSVLSFGDAGGSATFTINSNTSWTVSCNANWCSVSPTSGTSGTYVTVEATSNSSSASRSATITVRAGELTRTVTVSQAESSVSKPNENDNPLPQYSRKKK